MRVRAYRDAWASFPARLPTGGAERTARKARAPASASHTVRIGNRGQLLLKRLRHPLHFIAIEESMATETEKTRSDQPGVWKGRPPGMPRTVPPPSIPLAFLAASPFGLLATGAAWIWARGAAATAPGADSVVAAVHFGVLATLAMAVLGAMHQFTPVITGRPLRSSLLGRLTFASFLVASWTLPLGVATKQVVVTAVAGAMVGVAVVLLVINLAPALAVKGKGSPVAALRIAVAGAVATGFMGVLFVGDRQGNWFTLSGHVDMAMGVVGLFGWLGMTYVGVAEKLWPMFMLSHLPGRHRSGGLAVWGIALGVALSAPGLAYNLGWLAWPGAALVAGGLGAHLTSLAAHVRHRRRQPDLHLAYVLTSAFFLPVGAGLALAAVWIMRDDYHAGVALAAAAAAAFGGWVLVALVGHAYKVVPFIVWSVLRSQGVATGPEGKPLMFADLYNHTWAAISYVTVAAGMAALCLGLGFRNPESIAAAGALLAATATVTAADLAMIPLRMLRQPGTPAGPTIVPLGHD